MRSRPTSDAPLGVSRGDAAELAQAGRHVLVGALLERLGAPARSARVVEALEGWSVPERVQVAAATLAGLSSAAQLDAIVRALADMGADGAVEGVRRAGAERLLAGAEPAVAEGARRPARAAARSTRPGASGGATAGWSDWPSLATARTRVLEIQTKLHRWAGEDHDRRGPPPAQRDLGESRMR